MFERNIEQHLVEWRQRPGRKPLVLRGARQTGKTTLVRRFAKGFDTFVELNLEKDAIRRLFSEVKDIKAVIESIEGVCNRRIVAGRTLLFIDEIQNSVPAIKLLRFFHEEAPELHVIAAGSLLEVRMRAEGWSFPVGRVEFLYLYPASFDEFLRARGEDVLLESLKRMRAGGETPQPIHERLCELLLDYMIVGGMPEAVAGFAANASFKTARDCHEALSASFKEDFDKYSRGAGTEHLKSVWDRVPFEAGNRIKYSRLAGEDVRSREVSAAFDILHEAMLVERIFPTTRAEPPLVPKPKTAPKAQFLDIGLCAHAVGLTRDHLRDRLVSSGFSGGFAEVLAGQELLAAGARQRGPLFFWVREEKGSSSELDFLAAAGSRILPVEVKSGSQGSLKSLHQFLRRSGTDLGIRLYNGPLRLDHHTVALPDGYELRYRLLSVPLYLTFRLTDLCAGI
ncbi:MAG: ATP-binding protein [Elusimicrobia bacterium]|nr:ATP-binding protein [Elusimicrobiota bacterium]